MVNAGHAELLLTGAHSYLLLSTISPENALHHKMEPTIPFVQHVL
jgi:hypothetical protein